ncbi:MAG: hypothetical protein Q9164_006707 [Protoblastenia rupestris]
MTTIVIESVIAAVPEIVSRFMEELTPQQCKMFVYACPTVLSTVETTKYTSVFRLAFDHVYASGGGAGVATVKFREPMHTYTIEDATSQDFVYDPVHTQVQDCVRNRPRDKVDVPDPGPEQRPKAGLDEREHKRQRKEEESADVSSRTIGSDGDDRDATPSTAKNKFTNKNMVNSSERNMSSAALKTSTANHIRDHMRTPRLAARGGGSGRGSSATGAITIEGTNIIGSRASEPEWSHQQLQKIANLSSRRLGHAMMSETRRSHWTWRTGTSQSRPTATSSPRAQSFSRT